MKGGPTIVVSEVDMAEVHPQHGLDALHVPKGTGLQEFTALGELDRGDGNVRLGGQNPAPTFVGLGGIEGYVCANRVVIVVDKNGVVQHRWVAENPGVEPDYDAVVALAASL